MHTQLAVLGGGPGGYAAAFMAADLGAEVTLVEAEGRLGGTCLLRGCIPSKALLHVARVINEVDELRENWGVSYGPPKIDIDKIQARKNQVIDTLTGGLDQLAKRRNVRVIHAKGTFENSATLRFSGDSPTIPEDGVLTYDHLILATGSEVACPTALAVQSPRVMDSTDALELADVPASLLVVGGGYIGLEMGTIYAKLGSKISVVELTDGLLPGADRNLVRPLYKRLEELFEGRIHLNTRLGSLGERGDKVEAAFEGPEKFGTEHYDRVLIAVGRRPRTQGIGLENTQAEVSHRGFVVVDRQQRTADPHILAIGDVVGEPMLAHKASHEGKVAVEALLGHSAAFEPAAIPAVIFTDPEIAWAGLTEDQAKREGRKVSVALFPWGASGRAQALGRTEGLTKWIVDPETERLLGCGMVGPGAGELISEAVLAIEMQCEVRDIVQTIHPHPTLGETVMNSAEVFLGTATEIYKPRR